MMAPGILRTVSTGEFRIVEEVSAHDFPFSLIERIWNELDTPYEADQRLFELSEGQRALYSLTWIFSEVCNGGFDQCFYNSTGFLMPQAVEGAVLFGAHGWAGVLSEAAALLGTSFPLDRVARQERLDLLDRSENGRLRELDDMLYALDAAQETSLETIVRRYVDAHPSDFFLPNPPPEIRAQALLDRARRCIDGPQWAKNLDLAGEFLVLAQRLCDDHSLGRIGGQVESLLTQMPSLRG